MRPWSAASGEPTPSASMAVQNSTGRALKVVQANASGPRARAVRTEPHAMSASVIVVGLVSYFFTRRVQLGVRGKRLWRDVPGSPARAAETVGSAS